MRALVVDDEPLARRGLRRELDALPDVTCVAECATRDEAVAAIVAHRPDVVFLDVRLGRASAFEIIEAIGVDAMPLVVFVTAYDRHAVQAFEVHALDFVLKPVDPVRLREAVDRVAAQLALRREASLAERLEALLRRRAQEMPVAPAPPAAPGESGASDRLAVRDGERVSFVAIEQVDWVQSAGNYVRVHSGGRTYLMRTTMQRLARRLAPRWPFVRVRRSALVNVRAVTGLERYGKGTYVVHLRTGAKLISSRFHQRDIRDRLLRVE